jgi:hypothetical protein
MGSGRSTGRPPRRAEAGAGLRIPPITVAGTGETLLLPIVARHGRASDDR